MHRGLISAIGALLLVVAFARPSSADLDGDHFRSDEWKVSLKTPKGWRVTDRGSYPSVLLWMSRRRPEARMLFSAEFMKPGVGSQKYATQVLESLERHGYRVRTPQLHAATGAYYVDFDDGTTYLRQAVLVSNRIGYSLTLSAGDLRTRGQLLRAFDATLRSIRPLRHTSSAKE